MSDSAETVLVVDDDPAIVFAVKLILEGEGYRVATYETGVGVKGQVKKVKPQVIVLDYWLTGKNGDVVVKELKADADTRQIPIILFTASNKGPALARDIGAQDFLAKPFDMDELLQTVKSHLPAT